MSGNSLPRPVGNIDTDWFKKKVAKRRKKAKLAKANRKRNRS